MFDAFAEHAAVQGADNVESFTSYLFRRGPDDRFDAKQVADIAAIEPSRAQRLLDLAADPQFDYVAAEAVLCCPSCGLALLYEAAETEFENEESIACKGCSSEFESLDRWQPARRFRMTDRGLAEANPNPPTVSAVILTALPLEFAAVINHLDEVNEERKSGTIYTVGSFHGRQVDWRIAVAITEAGGGNAAAAAERAITHFGPAVALFVGIAGGLSEQNMKWGDVVAATEIYNYEWGTERAEFHQRQRSAGAAYSLRQQAQYVALGDAWRQRTSAERINGQQPDVVVEPIAAGEKLIRDRSSTVYERLRESLDKAVAVEMEGHGFLAALDQSETVAGIVVRGISDLCHDKDEAGRAGAQKIAAANAAAFAFELLNCYQPDGLDD